MSPGDFTQLGRSARTAFRVEFNDEISDVGYGLAIHFEMPGGVPVELYQPAYR